MANWHEVRVAGCAAHLGWPHPPGWMGARPGHTRYGTLCGRRIHDPDHHRDLGVDRDQRPPGLPCAVTCKDCRKVYLAIALNPYVWRTG